MTKQPFWVTPAGSLGTIPEGTYYSVQLLAIDDSPVKYELISGSLPDGMALYDSGELSGIPTTQKTGIFSKFAIRAYTDTAIADRTFSIIINGDIPPEFITPAGTLADYFGGSFITQPVPGTTQKTNGYQIEFTQENSSTVTLVQGSLPIGASVSPSGLISGFILPPDTSMWFNEYTFILEVSNGRFSSLRTFSIGVYNRKSLVASTTYITADNTWITADQTPFVPPIITTLPGSIGVTRVGNYFAFQFTAFYVTGGPYRFYSIFGAQIGYDQYPPYKYDEPGTRYDQGASDVPADLTLDPVTGWLYGRILPITGSSKTFSFGVSAYDAEDIDIMGQPVTFTITVVNEYAPEVTWLSPVFLGSIDNGSTSMFKIEAESLPIGTLYYRLPIDYYTSLPQGLTLLPNGLISGRVSFETFCIDGGTTTFDVTPVDGISDPTTFDLMHSFYVEVYSENGDISVIREFSIYVNRAYNQPYENLYIQAMPPVDSRVIVSSILSNQEIFLPSRIYRPEDPYFGVAKSVTYWHCYGLNPSTTDSYIAAMQINHYNKQLILGQIKTARATDSDGKIIYEVVYAEVIDTLVNNQGVSIRKQTVLPYPVGSNKTLIVYPNSLENMRDQIIDSLGQESNILPLWMLSTQANGSVLGFTPAWVLAYTLPNESGKIAYEIQQYLDSVNVELNVVNFEADRYEIDRALGKYWDVPAKAWHPTPVVTTFDACARPSNLVLGRIGKVDRGSFTSYFDIQYQTIEYINSIGGIDGPIDASINGKFIIFVKQQGYIDPINAMIPGPLSDTQAWTNYYGPYGEVIIPGQQEATRDPSIKNERMGIYLVTLVNNVVELSLIENTYSLEYLFIEGGNTFNNTQVYYPLGDIPVSWMPVPVTLPDPTTFDQDSMTFMDPVIEYEDVLIAKNNKYVLFPRPYIIPVPVE